jgi:transposase
MSRVRRKLLIKRGRESGDPATAQRFQIVAMLGADRSVTEVARALDVAIAHVSRVRQRFLGEGEPGLYDARRDNGARKATDEFVRALSALLLTRPNEHGWMRPTWTRELLCLQMERMGWPRVAVCTMGRALQRAGARLGAPKPVVRCPWPRARRERVLQAIRALEARASKSEPVLYCDEVDIHLNPKIGRDWMLRGHQRRILTPGKNEKFYLAGALDVVSGTLLTTGDSTKTAALFCKLLWVLAARYRRARRIHVVLDNYGIHKANLVERTLRELGDRIELHFLPPYCPDHNRIERVWLDVHADVTRNHQCKTMPELLDNIRRYVDAYRWRLGRAARQQLRLAA